MHKDWQAATDINPDQVTAMRHLLINLATSEKLLVQAFHFPFPGLGYIVQERKEWKWQAIEV
jgi:hypothetical protein